METVLRDMEAYARAQRVPILQKAARWRLLQAVKERRPRRILEIGTAIGYSALLFAAAAPDAEITTLELDEARAQTAARFFAAAGQAGRIRLLRGNASQLLETLAGPYDFVFIDAAKGQYPRYFRQVLPLLAPGGVIAADNVLFRGYVRDQEAAPRRFKTIVKRLREYLALVEAQPGFITTVYEDGDGLAVSVDRRNVLEKT